MKTLSLENVNANIILDLTKKQAKKSLLDYPKVQKLRLNRFQTIIE